MNSNTQSQLNKSLPKPTEEKPGAIPFTTVHNSEEISQSPSGRKAIKLLNELEKTVGTKWNEARTMLNSTVNQMQQDLVRQQKQLESKFLKAEQEERQLFTDRMEFLMSPDVKKSSEYENLVAAFNQSMERDKKQREKSRVSFNLESYNASLKNFAQLVLPATPMKFTAPGNLHPDQRPVKTDNRSTNSNNQQKEKQKNANKPKASDLNKNPTELESKEESSKSTTRKKRQRKPVRSRRTTTSASTT